MCCVTGSVLTLYWKYSWILPTASSVWIYRYIDSYLYIYISIHLKLWAGFRNISNTELIQTQSHSTNDEFWVNVITCFFTDSFLCHYSTALFKCCMVYYHIKLPYLFNVAVKTYKYILWSRLHSNFYIISRLSLTTMLWSGYFYYYPQLKNVKPQIP